MKSNKIQRTKKALVEALEKALGVVTVACNEVDINRTTFYRYMKEDPQFALAVRDTENAALDFAESQLFKQIKQGIPSSTIFYLKTKGKHRGYVERSEVETTITQNNELSEQELDNKVNELLRKTGIVQSTNGSANDESPDGVS